MAVGAVVEVLVEVVWMLWLRPVSGSDGAGNPNGDLVGGLRHRAAGGVGTQRGVVVVVIVVCNGSGGGGD